MQTETYLVAIGVLVLALILRPAPVVIVQRDRDESSVIGWFFGLVLIVGGAIWLFSKTGCTEASVKENGPTPEKANSRVHINEAPASVRDKSQDTLVNTAPPHAGIGKTISDRYYTPEEDEDLDLEPRLAVFLRSYQDYDGAEQLKNHFSQRDISIFEMTNGDFWAVVEVGSEGEGKKEIKDWDRHKKDWLRLGVKLKIVDLNDP